MNPKIVGIITMVAGVVILAAIVYLTFFAGKTATDKVTEEQQGTNTFQSTGDNRTVSGGNPGQSAEANPRKADNRPLGAKGGEEDLKKMALLFAERFGSFSNQSNFRNISDLKLFMTDSMKKWADGYIEEQNAKMNANDIYYGIITKAVKAETKSYEEAEGKASILVKTRRRETSMTDGNSSNDYNQDVLINFKKENNLWKVENAFWQSK